MRTWMTSWTTTASVLCPCLRSPKLNREVPKEENPLGRQNSLSAILALSLWRVLKKPLTAEKAWEAAALGAGWRPYCKYCWFNLTLVGLWMKCIASPFTLYLSRLQDVRMWTKCLYFQGFSSRATFLRLHWAVVMMGGVRGVFCEGTETR